MFEKNTDHKHGLGRGAQPPSRFCGACCVVAVLSVPHDRSHVAVSAHRGAAANVGALELDLHQLLNSTSVAAVASPVALVSKLIHITSSDSSQLKTFDI